MVAALETNNTNELKAIFGPNAEQDLSPFIVMRSALPALRVSNAIAVTMLFLTGYAYGRMTRHRPVLVGCSMVALGTVLLGLTMALGG